MTTFSRLHRYFDETKLCWRLGAGVSDRANLAIDTFLFHVQNARGKVSCPDDARVKHCRIRLPHRMDSPVDFHYRLRGGDLFILHEVLLDQCYWIPPVLTNVVKTVVDLGGNIGSATLSFASQFPKASFICVEPNPRNAAILAQNVAWLGTRAQVVQAAISDQDGEIQFNTDGAAWEGSLGEGKNSISVPSYRLETLLNTMGVSQVDVLKVDIEGAERALFASRGPWWDRVRFIIAELHDPYSFKDFSRDMDAIGFRAVAAGLGYGNLMPVAIRP